jgi:hypothetical protein
MMPYADYGLHKEEEEKDVKEEEEEVERREYGHKNR